MIFPKVSVTYEPYSNNICNGFAGLQQERQFVDMTLAADGHHVQVHQTIVALASPYLKELILSIPSKHPVIFLNNIGRDELCYLLEYIYTGEVEIPRDKVDSFIKNAKALHVMGIESGPIEALDTSNKGDFEQIEMKETQNDTVPQFTISLNGQNIVESNAIQPCDATKEIDITPASEIISSENALNQEKSLIDCLNADFEDCLMETAQKRITNEQSPYNYNQLFENQVSLATPDDKGIPEQIPENSFNVTDFNSLTNSMDFADDNVAVTRIPTITIGLQEPSELNDFNLLSMPTISIGSQDLQGNVITDSGPVTSAQDLTALCDEDIMDSCPRQYTVSNRGSIQMIMNRFMYFVHNLTGDGIKRRWRCVDYRTKKCQAYVDTEGETVVKRLNPHIHPFHDEKILKKITTHPFYTSYTTAATERDQNNRLS